MSDVLEFFAPGKPQTAGSKSAIPGKGRGGRPLIVESGDRKAKGAWRADLRAAALDGLGAEYPTSAPLDVAFIVVRKRPGSHYRTSGQLKDWARAMRPVARPDTTKLIRAAEDALEGIVWADDACIVSQEAHKVFPDQVGLGPGSEGMFVRVRPAADYRGPFAIAPERIAALC